MLAANRAPRPRLDYSDSKHFYTHSQIAGNEHADALAKMGAKITQTHIRETSYHSIKLHLKQMFQSVYRHELETKVVPKATEARNNQNTRLAKKKDGCRISTMRWACCLGTHLHPIGIRPDPYCMLCSLREPMDRNRLGQRTALFNRTECERYWEARREMMEN